MTISHSIAAALCVLGSLTGAAQASNINGTNEQLTIFSYQVGPRFSLRRHSRWVSYGQLLAGGTYFNHPLYGEARNVFSSTLGGGVTARRKQQFAVKGSSIVGFEVEKLGRNEAVSINVA